MTLMVSIAYTSTSSGYFATITTVKLSAKSNIIAPFGTGMIKAPLYITFRRRKPNTEPCWTPAVTLYYLGPSFVPHQRKLSNPIHFQLGEMNAFLTSNITMARHLLEDNASRVSSKTDHWIIFTKTKLSLHQGVLENSIVDEPFQNFPYQ